MQNSKNVLDSKKPLSGYIASFKNGLTWLAAVRFQHLNSFLYETKTRYETISMANSHLSLFHGAAPLHSSVSKLFLFLPPQALFFLHISYVREEEA